MGRYAVTDDRASPGGPQAASRASRCSGRPTMGRGPFRSCWESVKRSGDVPTQLQGWHAPMMPGDWSTAARGGWCDTDWDGGCWLQCWRPAVPPLTPPGARWATTPTSGSPSTWFPTSSRPVPSSTWPATSSPAPSWPGWLAPSIGRAMPTSSSCRVGWRAGAGRLRPPAGPRPPRGDRPLPTLQDRRGRVRPRLLKVMLARHRAGLRLAAAEARDGVIPGLRAWPGGWRPTCRPRLSR